jgi:predicted transcriptional regulator
MGDDPVDAGRRAALRGVAAVGAAPFAGLAGGSGGDPESEPRARITAYVRRVPGAHFSKVRDDLELATGETQHHLRRLESDGVVVSDRDGDYRRVFPANRFSAFERVALGYLRRDTPRGMLIELLRTPDATGAEIARSLDVSQPTISAAADALSGAGLLDRTDGYRIERPETVLALLVRYADSFGPRARRLAADADELVRYVPADE